jgi:hypothetical protein
MRCPDCAHFISDKAYTCPHCGRPLRAPRGLGVDYSSSFTFLGLPLVSIATGIDPETGRKRVAKGVIAIGDLAVGFVAIGGAAFGGIALGGAAVGFIGIGGAAVGILLALGGAAFGGVALGGTAVGLVAIGGGAVGYYALGGWAFGEWALGGNVRDAEAVEFFRKWLGSCVDFF